jgi:hypothetical protein
MKLGHPIALAAFLTLSSATLLAQTPSPGPRSIGMGGAFAATNDDATSLWGNPAGLAMCGASCGTLFGGAVGTDENHFASTLDEFSHLDWGNLSGQDLNRIVQALNNFRTPGTGVIASGSAGLVYGISGFGTGFGITAYTGIYPVIDLTDLPPNGNIADNHTAAIFKGLEAIESRLGYSFPLVSNFVYISADVRYIQGRTYYAQVPINAVGNNNLWDLVRDALRHNEVRTTRWSYDAGALVTPLPNLKIGFAGIALNQPNFTVFDGTQAKLPRTLRGGAAFAFTNWDGVVLAVDGDINKQETLVPNLKSQRLSAGLQVYWVTVGTFYDFAAVDPHWAWTAGLHLGTSKAAVDVAGVYSAGSRDLGIAIDFRVKL